jgi:hypothetical protein
MSIMGSTANYSLSSGLLFDLTNAVLMSRLPTVQICPRSLAHQVPPEPCHSSLESQQICATSLSSIRALPTVLLA